jgi:hypothetical protein
MRVRPIIVLTVILVCVLFTTPVHGFFSFNGTCEAFNCGEGGEEAASSTAPTIKQFIIVGAAHFLRSHSEFLALLQRIELSDLNGVDFKELQKKIDSAVESMEAAKKSYKDLRNLADATPYDPYVIEKLVTLDYASFQQEAGLNSVIFARVEKLLVTGDVRGTYNEFYNDVIAVLELLDRVKSSIHSSSFPNIQDLRRINQMYFEMLMFGQYTTEVFSNLR